ncbi:hypothetical protein QN277_023017 [Acacia crassicarpa]|uniref:Uncharacterized protein n=1 Tax=Acacia crassicarpa TaxID=499986 RepID=A0AAE1MR89_9FABA|nr:hypothetical protein QN277_023017 [Acacia crassicarpa]
MAALSPVTYFLLPQNSIVPKFPTFSALITNFSASPPCLVRTLPRRPNFNRPLSALNIWKSSKGNFNRKSSKQRKVLKNFEEDNSHSMGTPGSNLRRLLRSLSSPASRKVR